MEFTELQTEVHKLAVRNGFWPNSRSFGECIALIHSELSEALESDRIGNNTHIAEELADAVIRIMDLAESRNINLYAAMLFKHEKNLERPYKHGKLY